MPSDRARVTFGAALAAALLGDCRADPPAHRCTVVLSDPALGEASGRAEASSADGAAVLARARACAELADRSPAFVESQLACERWRLAAIGSLSDDAALALQWVCHPGRSDDQAAAAPKGVPADLVAASVRWLEVLFDARRTATRLCVDSTTIAAASTCERRTWLDDLAGGCGAALGN